MLKFKALFKRGPKTPRGGCHTDVESHSNSPAVEGSPPFSNPASFLSSSSASSHSSRVTGEVSVENGANDLKSTEKIMGDNETETTRKLKDDLRKYELLVADMAAENDQLRKMVERQPSRIDDQIIEISDSSTEDHIFTSSPETRSAIEFPRQFSLVEETSSDGAGCSSVRKKYPTKKEKDIESFYKDQKIDDQIIEISDSSMEDHIFTSSPETRSAVEFPRQFSLVEETSSDGAGCSSVRKKYPTKKEKDIESFYKDQSAGSVIDSSAEIDNDEDLNSTLEIKQETLESNESLNNTTLVEYIPSHLAVESQEPSDSLEVLNSTAESDEDLNSTFEIKKKTLEYKENLNDKILVEDIEIPSPPSVESQEVESVTPEVEVSQLQNHLRQMQESHYSTNEELQATIQELTDLQAQLDQTRSEKEKFREEKTLLLESLYRQTERLQTAKKENEYLQKLLHESGSERSVPEREKKLIELLTQGQENRETMICQINELEHKLNEVQRAKELAEEENKCLAERVRELEVTVDDVQYEKRVIEDELTSIKEEQNVQYFEILRLNVLLDIEESKVKELKAAHASLGNENELYAMMKNVMKEKELLEKKMAESEDSLNRTICENQRLIEDINVLQEQLTTLKESAANAMTEIETQSKLRKIEQKEASKKIEDLDNMLKNMEERYSILSQELQMVTKNLQITENKLETTIIQMEDFKMENIKEKQKRDYESAEWKQLHDDLLVAVRVANDIKMDTQIQLEKTVARVRELEEANADLKMQKKDQINKEKASHPTDVLRPPNVPKAPSAAKPLSAPKVPVMAKGLNCSTTAASHSTLAVPFKEPSFNKYSRPSLQAVNVKSLIESIENASKQTKPGQLESCSGSKAGSPQREINPPLPLREQPLTTNRQFQQTTVPVISELATPSDEKKDPLQSLVEKNGGSKRNALLKWVQNKTQGYPNIEITNFSSSWTDGLALCALLHTYLPHKIPFYSLTQHNKQYNFNLAFSAAEAEGIPTILNMNDMTQQERPDWQKVMSYVKEIYTHFEGHDSF